MERIAGYFHNVLADKKFVGDEVKEFRAGYQDVLYSFDRTGSVALPRDRESPG